jgi:sulfur relay (sulfurtransferase) complex TusBCD TusD component (DsrE family)
MEAIAGKKLGILISSHPDKGDLVPVSRLAEAALGAGVDCYLYLIDEGTRHYGTPALAALKDKGVKLYVCAYGGKSRGVEPDAGAVFGGLSALGGIMEGCDRFVAFN